MPFPSLTDSFSPNHYQASLLGGSPNQAQTRLLSGAPNPSQTANPSQLLNFHGNGGDPAFTGTGNPYQTIKTAPPATAAPGFSPINSQYGVPNFRASDINWGNLNPQYDIAGGGHGLEEPSGYAYDNFNWKPADTSGYGNFAGAANMPGGSSSNFRFIPGQDQNSFQFAVKSGANQATTYNYTKQGDQYVPTGPGTTGNWQDNSSPFSGVNWGMAALPVLAAATGGFGLAGAGAAGGGTAGAAGAASTAGASSAAPFVFNPAVDSQAASAAMGLGGGAASAGAGLSAAFNPAVDSQAASLAGGFNPATMAAGGAPASINFGSLGTMGQGVEAAAGGLGGGGAPSTFNPAQDSQAASAAAGYDPATMAAGGAPSGINFGSLGNMGQGLGGTLSNFFGNSNFPWSRLIGSGGDILSSIFNRGSASDNYNRQMMAYQHALGQIDPLSQRLQQSYSDPNSVLRGPEYQGIASTTLDQLQRQDAAGGHLANDIDRQAKMQQLASSFLQNYRTGLGANIGQLGNAFGNIAGNQAQSSNVKGVGDTNYNNGLGGFLGSLGSIFGNPSSNNTNLLGQLGNLFFGGGG